MLIVIENPLFPAFWWRACNILGPHRAVIRIFQLNRGNNLLKVIVAYSSMAATKGGCTMGQQPDQIGTVPQVDFARETGAPRKVWKSPEVILGTLAETETGSIANPDGGTGATAHAS